MSNTLTDGNIWKIVKVHYYGKIDTAEAYGDINDVFVAVSSPKIHHQNTHKESDIVLQLHDFSVDSRDDTGLT